MAVRLKCDSGRQEQGFGFEHRPFWEFASLVIKSLIMFMKVVCGVSFIALVVIAMQPPVRWASFMQFAQWALLAGIYAYMLGELEGLFSCTPIASQPLFLREHSFNTSHKFFVFLLVRVRYDFFYNCVCGRRSLLSHLQFSVSFCRFSFQC